MITEKNIKILKSEIEERFGFRKWKQKLEVTKIYGVPIKELNLLMLLMLYIFEAAKTKKANFECFLCNSFEMLPDLHDMNKIKTFLSKFNEDNSFMRIYFSDIRTAYKSYPIELVEYFQFELERHAGENDKARFINWIKNVDILEIERYGILYSPKAIQQMKRLMGQNIIVSNTNVIKFLQSLFDRKFNVHCASHIFGLIATDIDLDLEFINNEIDKIFV